MKRFIIFLVIFIFLSFSQIHANRWFDQIFGYSEQEKIRFLTIVTSSVPGISCAVTKYFMRGIDWDTAAFYIAVKCKNGEEYHVSIEDDKEGTSRVLECDVFETVTKESCWEHVE